MPVTATEVKVRLKVPPLAIFDDAGPDTSNYFRFRLSPEVVISAGARVKRHGEDMRGDPVELIARHEPRSATLPYERLLRDALRGDTSLFTRDDSVEAAWRVVDPALAATAPVHLYDPGSWGPCIAADIVASGDGWSDPQPEESS
jgi:glucose-6-phosphate 1-dehydrogenase